MAAQNTDKLKKVASNTGWQVGGGGVADAVVTTIPGVSLTGLPTDTALLVTVDRVDSSGTKTPTKMERFIGVVSGNNFVSCIRGVEGLAQPHAGGAVIECVIAPKYWNDIVDWGLVEHNQDGTHKGAAVATPVHAASSKATPVDADEIGLLDSATSFVLSKLTWANLKATFVSNLKAAGSDITTGTNDTKVVTPKAIADAGVNTRLKSKIIAISRDMTLASGSVAYTGIGFQPTSMVAIGCINGSMPPLTVGIADSGRNAFSLNQYGASAIQAVGGLLNITVSPGVYQAAAVASFDADGFTLTWTKAGSPTGTGTAYVLCIA